MLIFDQMRVAPEQWHATDEATFYEMLGAVPPAGMGNGCFLMGEPIKHNSQGEPVFACFKQTGDVFEARHMTINEFQQLKGIRK